MKFFVVCTLLALMISGVYAQDESGETKSDSLKPKNIKGINNGFTVNVYNTTGKNAFVYIDGQQAFVVESKQKLTGYVVQDIKTILAVTFDKKNKWGPIDVSNRKEDFYWKLVHKDQKQEMR